MAIESGSADIVALLLDHGATTPASLGYKYSAPEGAVVSGDSAACRLLLGRGADVNEVNKGGCTSLQVVYATDGVRNQRVSLELCVERRPA